MKTQSKFIPVSLIIFSVITLLISLYQFSFKLGVETGIRHGRSISEALPRAFLSLFTYLYQNSALFIVLGFLVYAAVMYSREKQWTEKPIYTASWIGLIYEIFAAVLSLVFVLIEIFELGEFSTFLVFHLSLIGIHIILGVLFAINIYIFKQQLLTIEGPAADY